MKIFVPLAALAALAVSACDTTTAHPYAPSTANILAAQSVLQPSNSRVSVGRFGAATNVSPPQCRAAGALDVAPGRDIPTYIREAFQTELFQAGVYQQGATEITGTIDQLDVNTFGTGSWTIAMTLRSSALPSGYRVQITHTFASSFSAYAACQNATTAFNPAVQSLLSAAINHPMFGRLSGRP